MGDKRHTSPTDRFQIIYVDIFPQEIGLIFSEWTVLTDLLLKSTA